MKSLQMTAVLLGLCGAAACGNAPKSQLDGGTPSESQDIVGGQPTSEFPAVGYFVNSAPSPSPWEASCTASLIAPRSILTAAHCVMALDSNGEDSPQAAQPNNLVFYLGSSGAQKYRASAVNLPGGTSFPFSQFIANVKAGQLNDDDLAVVTLQQSPQVTPMTLSTTALTANQKVWSVGYGTTGNAQNGSTGTKRYMYTFISGFVDDNIVAAGNASYGTCSGDSGGPLVPGYNTIAAITQAGEVDGNTCAGNDDFTLVAPWASFISSVAE